MTFESDARAIKRGVHENSKESSSDKDNQYDDVPESKLLNESLILAQNQRWRRASDMQVERERPLRGPSRVASG